MTEAQFLEAIGVQVTLGQMMPAAFSRQCLDAIAFYIEQRKAERTYRLSKSPSLRVDRNLSLGVDKNPSLDR
jgi:hypothetical protein